MIARMATATQELPRYFEIVANIETNWKRYVVYASLAALVFAYLLSCIFLPQFEDMISEARRQRYVPT